MNGSSDDSGDDEDIILKKSSELRNTKGLRFFSFEEGGALETIPQHFFRAGFFCALIGPVWRPLGPSKCSGYENVPGS